MMAEIAESAEAAGAELYCEHCDCVMAPDWKLSYCPLCGGKVGPVGNKPKSPKPPSEKLKYRRWDRAKRKTSVQEEKQAEQIRSEAFDTLRQSAVPALFIINILTLGLRSIFWITRRLDSIKNMTIHGESPGKPAVYMWLCSYLAAFLLVFASYRELLMSEWDFSLLTKSIFLRAGIFFYAVSFVAGRHILLWAREVITDAIESDKTDLIRTKADAFAPSPLSLWFIGVPYLQLHLNEIARARNLASFKYSKHRAL
jgi:hypothetical protein